MAKKNEVDNVDLGFTIDTTEDQPQMVPMSQFAESEPTYNRQAKKPTAKANENELISCLKREKVIVRYINKPNANITNPRHVLYGGMAESAVRSFTVPMLRSGALANVLTDSEKDFLESYMGLEHNWLSVYNKTSNYWRNYTVRLTKTDSYLDLSVAEDYIKYKVLLANKDYICPGISELADRRKATYEFVLINDGDEVREISQNMSVSMEASIELGKIIENKQVLKYVVEILSGKPISKKSTLDFIKPMAFKEMQSNPKLFLSVVKDPYLKTKVLISECLDSGLLRKRNDMYYLSSNSEPLCEMNEESTLSTASKYLNSPKRQEVKLTLEAKLNALKE